MIQRFDCRVARRTMKQSSAQGLDYSIPFSNGSRGTLLGFGRLGMPVFSTRSQVLDGVSWARGGEVENAVGWLAACYTIGAVVCSLPWASLLTGARCGLLRDRERRCEYPPSRYRGQQKSPLNSLLFRFVADANLRRTVEISERVAHGMKLPGLETGRKLRPTLPRQGVRSGRRGAAAIEGSRPLRRRLDTSVGL
jgi:hypothetical protein